MPEAALARMPLPDGGVLEVEVPPGIHPLAPATVALAAQAFAEVRLGKRGVLDLGCGAGFLGLAAAAAGARRVVATDVDPLAVGAAARSAARNGLRIETRVGDWFGPVRNEAFDLVVANPPQTPALGPIQPDRWGGPDGLRHLLRVAEEAPRHLEPGGVLLLLTSTLADLRALERRLRARFRLRLASEIGRPFRPEEYEALQPGLFGYLRRLRDEGKASFDEDGTGGCRFGLLVRRCELLGPGRTLVVHADDLGIDAPRNRGIVEACARGVVTSASVLANGPALEDALRRLRDLPDPDVGVHLNLTEGTPLAAGATLRGADGRFLGKEAGRRNLLEDGGAEEAEVEAEFAAQVARVLEAGVPVSHLDGHQHVHVWPRARRACLAVARRFGIAWVRTPLEDAEDDPGGVRRPHCDLAQRASALRDALAGTGCATADRFIGESASAGAGPEEVRRLLSPLGAGVAEWMVHPGYAAPDSVPFSNADREAELRLLTDRALLSFLREQGFRLSGFRALRPPA
ncbi:MAG TPA: ChbG/HpnK family deacetylase [Planctomycetota bacterium]|nr:ChbG/HpnK family deacetylase [Planctomycetota bacterium]